MSARATAAWFVVACACASSVVPLLHCAQAGDASSAGADSFDASPDTTLGGDPGRFADETPLPDNSTECAETNKQIYVLGTDRFLYRFYPDKLKFDRVGQVACPSVSGTFSMAINRRGTAFVEYQDGRLYAVDTSNGRCRATPFRPGQTGFERFGMGYARDGDAAGGETLYVSGIGLASLETKTFSLNFLGSLTYGRTELTSLDTQLFAFSVGSGVIAGLNKSTGATESVYRTTAVNERAAFAFAQWGGDFWIFTGDEHSSVTQYSPTENKSNVVIENTGMLIVGAGSSTCAPTTKPPR